MSNTPRTDEHLRMKEENGHVAVVSSDFARQLETELVDKEKQLAEARDKIGRLQLLGKAFDKGGAKMIEVRKMCSTQIDGVSLFVVFYNGICKKVYARNEKEAEEKARACIEDS